MSAKKYLILAEGACTEPQYFDRVVENRNDLGINGIVTFEKIPRLLLDENETDIENMIQICHDYVVYCRDNILSRRLFESIFFESAYAHYKVIVDNRHILGKNEALLELRSKLDKKLDEIGIGDIIDDDHKQVVKRACLEVLSKEFKANLRLFPVKMLSRTTIADHDEICIVRDRDFSKSHFPDDKYERAVKKVEELNSSLPRYRLVITYPKFELWMLMHSDIVVGRLDFKALQDYSVKVKEKGTRPSLYVDKLMDEYLPDIWQFGSRKRINPYTFDPYLLRGLDTAIGKARDPKLTEALDELKTRPGTMMGVLLSDMKKRSSLLGAE